MLDMKKVGKNIKVARTEKNMTQLELADILGVSYQAVSNWERGNTMPDIAKLPEISKALDIEIVSILGEENTANTVAKILDNDSEPLSSRELTDVAPILPPKEISKEIKKTSANEKLNIKAIVGLAPYLDDEILDEIVGKVDTANVKELVPLAPYLSDKTMIDISNRVEESNIHDLVALAPFLSNESLDKIVDMAIESDNVAKLSKAACFLGRKSLKKIANHLVNSDDDKVLSKFAMYM